MKASRLFVGKSGIYQIRNLINGKVYIGRTKCFYKRCYQYLYDFRTRSIGHLNEHLFRSISKYGIDNFTFEILEFCSVDVSPERELFWINKSDSMNRAKGYNIRIDVGGRMITNPETSSKISNRLKIEWFQGVRSNHGEKMKINWVNRDHAAQSKVMTRNLTKYSYSVDGVKVQYSDLRDLKLHGVLTAFFRSKSDSVIFKKRAISRTRLT